MQQFYADETLGTKADEAGAGPGVRGARRTNRRHQHGEAQTVQSEGRWPSTAAGGEGG